MNRSHEAIGELRKKTGKTQEQVAEEVGVSVQSLTKWINGGFPALNKAFRLAKALEVSMDELCEAFNLTGGPKND